MNKLVLYADPRRKYSVERLRSLYSDLLQCIDVDNENLCPRGVEGSSTSARNFRSYLSLTRRYSRQRINSDGEMVDEDERTALKKQELVAAFRLIAASRSGDKEIGISGDVLAVRNEVTVGALKLARKLESTVANIIREIGEVVVNAERPPENAKLRDDDTFAYFCEKAILVMLVEIFKDKPKATINVNCSCFRGVVWSAKVKAQVLHTVSLLVSGVRDMTALYFILSQHCINQLILSMVPLTQWTDPALEVMLSAYTDLLKTLSLQLGGSPELFPFFTYHSGPDSAALFPMFSAIIQIITSSHAQSDSYVHAMCLNLIVGLMRISEGPVRTWICQAEREQRQLCSHICCQLTKRYRRIANLTMGPVVDTVRSNSIGAQLASLSDQIDAVNDVFWCNINILNVRLCETLLQQFVHVLVSDLLPGKDRKLLRVGVSDSDVIPDREASAQSALFVLSRMFLSLEYGPFVRMVAVTLFHPKSSTIWESNVFFEREKEYVLMPALNALVQGDEAGTILNIFREEIMKSLSGDYGEWRVIPSVALLENAIKVVDDETLAKLELFPAVSHERHHSTPILEIALASFLSREHTYQSTVSTVSLECAALLAVQYIYKVSMVFIREENDCDRMSAFLRDSPLMRNIRSAKSSFFQKTLEAQRAVQVNDIFVDVVEAVVRSRYKRYKTVSYGSRQQHIFAFQLTKHESNVYCSGPEPLTRTIRGVDLNDVELTRFYADMAIHFRAICRVIDRFYVILRRFATVEVVPTEVVTPPGLDLVDEAGELSSMFGCLLHKPPVGTDLDLNGRMAFGFSVSVSDPVAMVALEWQNDKNRIQTLSDDMIIRESSNLAVVLDPTDMFVVKPYARHEVNRGTIICCISLLDVVAAAVDNERLHIAVRHDNIGFLIKNGNMVLTFDSAGTCLIASQYLDRCRTLLRKELYGKIVKLFSGESPSNGNRTPANEVPHVKTF